MQCRLGEELLPHRQLTDEPVFHPVQPGTDLRRECGVAEVHARDDRVVQGRPIAHSPTVPPHTGNPANCPSRLASTL
jgi:hypothetical protein